MVPKQTKLANRNLPSRGIVPVDHPKILDHPIKLTLDQTSTRDRQVLAEGHHHCVIGQDLCVPDITSSIHLDRSVPADRDIGRSPQERVEHIDVRVHRQRAVVHERPRQLDRASASKDIHLAVVDDVPDRRDPALILCDRSGSRTLKSPAVEDQAVAEQESTVVTAVDPACTNMIASEPKTNRRIIAVDCAHIHDRSTIGRIEQSTAAHSLVASDGPGDRGVNQQLRIIEIPGREHMNITIPAERGISRKPEVCVKHIDSRINGDRSVVEHSSIEVEESAIARDMQITRVREIPDGRDGPRNLDDPAIDGDKLAASGN